MATLAGLNIYRAALNDPVVTRITLLQRREMPSWAVLPDNASTKSSTVLHSDFMTYSSELASQLAQHDACVWAMGKSSQGVTEEEYTTLAHDMPLALLEALQKSGVGEGREHDKPFRFIYLSGEGADPKEKSHQMWARVKGRTEKDLASFCSTHSGLQAHILRPGYFFPPKEYPADRENQRSATAGCVDKVIGPVASTLIPNMVSPPSEMSQVAVAVAKGRWPQSELIGSKEMRKLVKELES